MEQWTPQTVQGLYEAVAKGSVDELRNFFRKHGFEELPKENNYRHEGNFDMDRLWRACVRGHDSESYKWLRGHGMRSQDLNPFEGWGPVYEHAKDDPLTSDEQVKIVEFLYALSEDRWDLRKGHSSSWELDALVYALLPENVDLLEKLHDAGIDVGLPSVFFFSSSRDCWLAWDGLFTQNRQATMDFLAKHGLFRFGYDGDAEYYIIPPGTPAEALNHALDLGLPCRYVSPNGSKELLLTAAHRGLRPAFYSIDGFRVSTSSAKEGMELLSAQGDAEVVEAFVRAGVTEGASVAAARVAGNDAVAQTLLSLGFSDVPTIVFDLEPFIDPSSRALVVPEGVKEIAYRVRKAESRPLVSSITLPTSLRRVGPEGLAVTWCGERPSTVTVPKDVAELGENAFKGLDNVTLYDTFDTSAPVRMGHPIGERLGCRCITVRSAENDQIKYRIFCDLSYQSWLGAGGAYAGSWGPHALFDFGKTDKVFDSLSHGDKIQTAICRLRWPVDLTAGHRARLDAFCRRNASEVVKGLIDWNDIEGLEFFLNLGLVTSANIDELCAHAKKALESRTNASNASTTGRDENGEAHDAETAGQRKDKTEPASVSCYSKLLAYQKALSDGAVVPAEAPSTRKLPVSQVVTILLDALREGQLDWNQIESLRGRPLKTVRPAAVVDLFEAAAELADPTATRELYKLFGQPEYQSGALAEAIRRGNTQTALELCKQGADLSERTNKVEVKGDTPTKSANRREGYLHGNRGYGNAYARALSESFSWEQGQRPSGYRAYGSNREEDVRRVEEEAERAFSTVVELVQHGSLGASDLKLLCMTLAETGRCDRALRLVELGADDVAPGFLPIWVKGGIASPTMANAYCFDDLLRPRCFPKTARFVCEVRPQAPSDKWSPEFLQEDVYLRGLHLSGTDPAVVKELIPYLRPKAFQGSRGALVRMLASHGWTDELRIVSGWDKFFTCMNLTDGITLARDAGHEETAAYLEGEKGKKFGDGKDQPWFRPLTRVGKAFAMTIDKVELKGSQFATANLGRDADDVERIIKDGGGTLNNRVSAKTDYLIICDSEFAHLEPKFRRALDLNDTKGTDIKVITTTEFYQLAAKE